MTTACPCCGGPISAVSPEQLLFVRLQRRRKEFLQVMIEAYPKMLHSERIITRMWGTYGEGAPDSAEPLLHNYACHVRKAIRPFGWTIRSSRFHGYVLEPVI